MQTGCAGVQTTMVLFCFPALDGAGRHVKILEASDDLQLKPSFQLIHFSTHPSNLPVFNQEKKRKGIHRLLWAFAKNAEVHAPAGKQLRGEEATWEWPR